MPRALHSFKISISVAPLGQLINIKVIIFIFLIWTVKAAHLWLSWKMRDDAVKIKFKFYMVYDWSLWIYQVSYLGKF